jgi:hypothetical protein
MAAEPSRRLTYSHQLTYAENALSEQVLDRSPPASEAVLTTAFRSAWHALLTRLHTLQVPKPAPQHSCAPLSPPRLGLTSRRGTIEQEWDRALARTLQCIDQKEHARKLGESKRAALGASKRAAPPLPQRRDTQRAKTGVNALTFNTPAASPPLGPLPPATVQPVAGQSAKGRKRQLPPNLEENHPDTRNRACVFPRAPQPQSPRYGAPHTPRHRAHEGPDRGRPRFVASSTKRADERIAYKHERQELAFAENVEEHGHMGSQDLECATHAPSPPRTRSTRLLLAPRGLTAPRVRAGPPPQPARRFLSPTLAPLEHTRRVRSKLRANPTGKSACSHLLALPPSRWKNPSPRATPTARSTLPPRPRPPLQPHRALPLQASPAARPQRDPRTALYLSF